MLEADPTLTPAQLRDYLTSTASQALSPDFSVGFGKIDALAAVDRARAIWVDFAWPGSEDGSYANPYNTLAEAEAHAGASAASIRIKPSATSETVECINI